MRLTLIIRRRILRYYDPVSKTDVVCFLTIDLSKGFVTYGAM